MLNYDFDLLQLVPEKQSDDPYAQLLEDMLSELEPQKSVEDTYVALFREAETVEALTQAHPTLRDFFLASGFGLNTFNSGAPAGHYPIADEELRIKVIERLAANAQKFLLPPDAEAGPTTFRLADFLHALGEAEPYPAAEEGDAIAAPVETRSLANHDAADHGSAALSRLPSMISALTKLGSRQAATPVNEIARPAPAMVQKLRFWHGKTLFFVGLAIVGGGGMIIPQAIGFL